MSKIYFSLPIIPMALQTAGKRMVLVGGKPRFFKNPKAQAYLDAIEILAGAHRPPRPFAGAIRLDLTFVLPRPKRLLRRCDPDGLILHTSRPDRDNLIKGTQDGLSLAGFWLDDSQICMGETQKFYAERGGSRESS